MPKSTANTFENLHLSKPVLSALAKCDYKEPTPIQEEGIPLVLAGKDIIAKAPTGTGKTAVFVLPALELLLKAKSRVKPRILILTPTRELATQITDVVYKLGRDLKINAATILGGMPYKEQLRKLSRPNDIIIATPGRLIDYMNRGNMDFSEIEMLVLDEADRMLDMGFIDDVKMIANATPKDRQTLLFTATLDGRLVKLAGNMLKSPEHIEVGHKKETLDNITQRVYIADDHGHKTRLLQHLLASENVYKAIIFSATKRNADELAKQLRLSGYSATAMHGDMRQHKRNTTITQFKGGKIQLLIATDVAARGIDVDDLSHVFIYDLSKFAEDHVHRIGRTGRAGKKGTAISLALPADGVHLQKIERMIKQSIPRGVVAGLEPRRSLDSHARKPASKFKSGKFTGKFSRPSRENSNFGGYASKSKTGFRDAKPKFSRSSDADGYASRGAPRGRSGDSEGYAQRGRSSHSESYTPRGRSGDSDGYASRGRTNHSESYAPRGRSSHSEGYTSRGRSGDSDGYASRGRTNHSESYAPRGRSSHSEGYTSRGRSSDSDGYASRGRSNHSESHAPRGRSSHAEGYASRGRPSHSEGYAAKSRTGKSGHDKIPKKSFGPRSDLIKKSRKKD